MLSHRILCFGDSLTEGYSKTGREYHPYTLKLAEQLKIGGINAQVDNHGISWEKTDSMVPRFTRTIRSSKYNSVVILGGTHDLGDRTPQKTFENLKQMHDLAIEKNINCFAVTIPEIATESLARYLFVARNEINTRLRDYCVLKNVPLIDLAKLMPFQSLTEAQRKQIWDDNLHFTASGYDQVGEIVYKCIVNHLV